MRVLKSVRIDTKRGRDALEPRREPYWYKLARDRHLGLRKLHAESTGAWIARFRDEASERHYKSLGESSSTFDFDAAKVAAESWFRDQERGVRDRDDDGGPATVATACRAYVRSLRAEGRLATAHDAHMRLRRTVYGDSNDDEFGPALRRRAPAAGDPNAPATASKLPVPKTKPRNWRPVPHAIANLPLVRVRTPRLKKWHLDLVSAGLSKTSANRTLSALKAALNLAVANRTVSALVAQEWAEVQLLKEGSRRRDLFLDVMQRRALLANSQGGINELMEAVIHTGCRAGELTSARRSAFDARTKSLTVSGKTGTRTIPLTPAAVTLFNGFAKDKLPNAFLLTRDDGKPWAHSDWDWLVKDAASQAGLPAKTCLYTLRHSFITQALLDGVSTLEVSKIAGTSLAMIEKHYGHLVQDIVRERLAKVQMV
jgi:integrase